MINFYTVAVQDSTFTQPSELYSLPIDGDDSIYMTEEQIKFISKENDEEIEKVKKMIFDN